MSPTSVRVAWCIDSLDVGGSELNAVRTAEQLAKSGCCLHLFHFHNDGPLLARYKALGIPMRHVPMTGFLSRAAVVQAAKVAGEIRQWKLNIVHCHDIYTNIFYAPVARLLSSAKVITSRRWWKYSPRAGLPSLNRAAYRMSHRVLANSASVASMLVKEEGVSPSRVVEVPNFIDDSFLQSAPPESIRRMRKEWGIPPEAFVVGTVARLVPVKRHDTLLKAASRLPQDVHILLIGDGPERSALQELVASLGLQARVHFAGKQLASINLHELLDVSVLCSESEGFPNTLVEALGASRPVIATPVGGVLDLIQSDATGILTPVADSTALAVAVARFRQNPALGVRLGAAGRALVKSRYSRDGVMSKLLSVYRDLAAD